MSKTTFYTDDGNRILVGAGITFAEWAEAWRRLHGDGHKAIGDAVKPSPIDLGTAPLKNYSNVEHVELDLEFPSGLCTINEDGSCRVEFKE